MKIRCVDIGAGRQDSNASLSTSFRSFEENYSQSLETDSIKTNQSHDMYMEDAVTSLSVAMKELHTELRDKTNECEALLDTATALSDALQESEHLLAEKTLECERLQLKLQMVTFYEIDSDLLEERNIHATTDVMEEAEALLAHHRSPSAEAANVVLPALIKSKKKVLRKEEHKVDAPRPEAIEEDVMPQASHTVSTIPEEKPYTGPVSVDDVFNEEEEDNDLELNDMPTEIKPTSSALDVGPRQIHFYQVIQERDQALYTVKKLSFEVKHARKKNNELKAKLARSTALNELAYLKKERKGTISKTLFKKQFTNSGAEVTSSLPSVSSSLTKEATIAENDLSHKRIPWFRRGSSSNEHPFSSEKMIPYPLEGNSTGLVSEQDYLLAIASNDADRAGGLERLSM